MEGEMSQLAMEQSKTKTAIREVERLHAERFSSRFDFVISGSGSMLMHGIDRDKPIGDIDLFATTEAWMAMAQSGKWMIWTPSSHDAKRRHDPPYLYRKFPWGLGEIDTMEVNIFFEWRRRNWGNIEVKELFDKAREIERILCVDMQWLLAWKEEVRRPKDIPDIDLIRSYLMDSSVVAQRAVMAHNYFLQEEKRTGESL